MNVLNKKPSPTLPNPCFCPTRSLLLRVRVGVKEGFPQDAGKAVGGQGGGKGPAASMPLGFSKIFENPRKWPVLNGKMINLQEGKFEVSDPEILKNSPKLLQNVLKCFKILQNASKCFKNASKCFKMLQNASKCFKMLQNA